jgi:hypothetical protein
LKETVFCNGSQFPTVYLGTKYHQNCQ